MLTRASRGDDRPKRRTFALTLRGTEYKDNSDIVWGSFTEKRGPLVPWRGLPPCPATLPGLSTDTSHCPGLEWRMGLGMGMKGGGKNHFDSPELPSLKVPS